MAAAGAITPQGTAAPPLVEGDRVPACAECSFQWQALRQTVALRAAQERIDALEDDLHRLRRELGHERPILAVVAPLGREA